MRLVPVPAVRLDPVALVSICVIALCLGVVAGVVAARGAPQSAPEVGMRSVPTVADEPPQTPCDAILEWSGACPPFRSA